MKHGYGTHHLLVDGTTIAVVPGQEIECDEWKIRGALDKFDCLDPPAEPPQPTAGLIAKHKGGGRWVVLNETSGAQINDGYLTKEEAITIAKGQGKFKVDENEDIEDVNKDEPEKTT